LIVKLAKIRDLAIKEMRRSPRKCVVLAMMIPVALYFWVPLVAKWSRKGNRSVATKSAPPAPVGGAATMPALSGAVQASAANTMTDTLKQMQAIASRWNLVLERMRHDPRARSIAWNAESRNPFHHASIEIPEVDHQAASGDSEQTVSEFERAVGRLRLEGTIISPQRSIASINGWAFREGETIDLRLLGIRWRPRSVVKLERVAEDRVELRSGREIVALLLPRLEPLYAVAADTPGELQEE
jgi:hypothetical protein